MRFGPKGPRPPQRLGHSAARASFAGKHSRASLHPHFCSPGRASCGSDAAQSPYSGCKNAANDRNEVRTYRLEVRISGLNVRKFRLKAGICRAERPPGGRYGRYGTEDNAGPVAAAADGGQPQADNRRGRRRSRRTPGETVLLSPGTQKFSLPATLSQNFSFWEWLLLPLNFFE
jgi:hypothetical protein